MKLLVQSFLKNHGLHGKYMDEAGVHPLLFIGSERYTPILEVKQPAELSLIANHIFGFWSNVFNKSIYCAAKEDNRI